MLISDKLKVQFDDISNILRNIGERVEGNLYCDFSPDNIIVDTNIEKIYNLQQLVLNKQKICEIGVNAGHSLLIMLEQNPNAEYLLFDLGNHGYTQPCFEYIKTQYPTTKINIVYGDSKETIPNFILNNKNTLGLFDLIHIDGGHGFLEVCADFYNCRYLTNVDGLTIFDDYNYVDIKNFIDNRVNAGIIKQYQTQDLRITDKHFIYKI